MSMHLNWNKSFSGVLASSVAMLLMATGLNAIPRDPCEPPPPPVCCEEPKPGPFAFAYPFDMDLNCPRDFYFRIDGLAFQAKEDGLEWGIEDSSTPAITTPITNGEVRGFSSDSHDWHYNPGARVGVGFYLDHDAWNIDFAWTWVNITNHRHGNASTSLGSVLPLWALGIGTPPFVGHNFTTAGKWDVHYDMIDVRLGKPHYVSRYLVMNPHFGFRGGWIDQHFSVHYGGNAAQGPTFSTVFHSDNKFWGVGARAGLDSDWILGKGWCLFGNMAASMLFGQFEIDQNYSLPGATVPGYDIDYDFYQNVPNFELALGIGWGKYFNKKRNHVSLRAAYEFHQWWNQLHLRQFLSSGEGLTEGTNGSATGVQYTGIYTNVASHGDFTMNGFSLRLQFDI